MNERQLESFILSADEKSFSKAATKSYISTPALVQQINLLEKSIGFKLFERGHQGISLTPSGENFYQAAKEILSIYKQACKKGQELENHQQIIKVAYPFEKFPPFLLKAYQEFHKKHHHVLLEFIPLPFNQHIHALKNKEVDLSVIARPEKSLIQDLTFDTLYQDTYSFCMSPSHPLAHKKRLSKKDLEKYPLLIGQYTYLEKSFEKQLPPACTLTFLNQEYDLTTCSNLLVSNEMMVIHSLWKDNYTSLLKVIPSSINAGDVGILYHKEHKKELDLFLEHLKSID